MGFDLYWADIKGEPHLSTLASCALVCRDWYFLTWYHLHEHIYLRDRNDVVAFLRTSRERPHLREVVRQVTISGASPGERHSIRHIGTFAAMLTGKVPKLETIIIRDAGWTIGSARMEDFTYLATYCSVHTLYIANVTLSNITQLVHLVSALPALVALRCFKVDCLQKPLGSLVSLPLNCANLQDLEVRWVAPAVEDLFVWFSQTCRARYVNLGVDGESNQSLNASRSQTLLDASSASAGALELHINIGTRAPECDGSSTIDPTVEQHYDLSRHKNLWKLDVWLYHPFVAWSWITQIFSRVTSKHLCALSVVLLPRKDHLADDLDTMLKRMEEDGVLARLDNILQEKRFSDTVAPHGICLGFGHDDNAWTPVEGLFRTDPVFQRLCDRWDELVRRRMPQSHRRGILTTVHNFHGVWDWTKDMGRTHSMIAGTNGGVEAQPEGEEDY